MYTSGEYPGKGRYICTNCSRPLYLEDNLDELPLCPECNNHQYVSG